MTKISIVHLPDLSFVQYLQQEFGINRGVFNTIDAWFYQKGYIDIIQRRQLLLHFLQLALENDHTGRKMKFGHGGLVLKLNDYLGKYGCIC